MAYRLRNNRAHCIDLKTDYFTGKDQCYSVITVDMPHFWLQLQIIIITTISWILNYVQGEQSWKAKTGLFINVDYLSYFSGSLPSHSLKMISWRERQIRTVEKKNR